MGVSAAIGVGVLIAGGSLYESNQQNKLAQQQMNYDQQQETNLQNQYTQEQQNEMQQQSSKAIKAKASAGSSGSAIASGTILTGALGISSIPNNSNKTLLGA